MGKNKGGDKNAGGAGGKGAKGGKGGNEKEEKKGGAKKNGLKIKIRHILWYVLRPCCSHGNPWLKYSCSEKQSRMEEAMRKIKEDGDSFDKVAREFSEDKAKQGTFVFAIFTFQRSADRKTPV